VERKSRLPALTGLRAFAALNLVFFHFSDPKSFGWFAPVVYNGYTSVSFFLLLSGFILTYNYSERAAQGQLRKREFWIARLSRLYPVYIFTLLISVGMLIEEFRARSHGQFALGTVLTPLLLQGWDPALATFWNTPAWTMSTEAFFYVIFPFVVLWKRPRSVGWLLALMLGLWLAGMVVPALYTWFHPDGDLWPGRYSSGIWLRALKFTPPPHLPSFLFGIALADLNQRMPLKSYWRLVLGAAGLIGIYITLHFADHLRYVFLHDGLLMPLFGSTILGLAGQNPIARFFGFRPFVKIGEASYCLYLLHFNLWDLLHRFGWMQRTHLIDLDPWISYLMLVTGAVMTMTWIERPGQRWIKARFDSLAKGKAATQEPAGAVSLP
jgi:peptidoglycan/LPS O-acetylase OafA/YrhL